jgi:hypothetical protein
MDMEIDLAITLIEDVASNDLETCLEAVKAGHRDVATAALDQAITRLGAAIDTLRSIPRGPDHDLGLQAMS